MTPSAIKTALEEIHIGKIPEFATNTNPVQAHEFRKDPRLVTREIFSDETIPEVSIPDIDRATEIPVPGLPVSPLAARASGCNYRHSTWAIIWTNCKTTETNPLVGMGYRIDAYKELGHTARITIYQEEQGIGMFATTSFTPSTQPESEAAIIEIDWAQRA